MMMARLKQFYDSHIGLPIDPDATEPGIVGRPIHTHPGLMIIVFVGGSLGALAHYGVMCIVPYSSGRWPLATFLVNLTGAFVLGLLLQTLVNRGADEGLRRLFRLGIGTGFLGAFTTYSTFAVEVDLLLNQHRISMAVTYAVGSLVGGMMLTALGIYIATNHHHGRHTGVNV